MNKETAIKIFEEKQVRSIWDTEQEKWYISIIDVIEILTGSPRPRKYWNALKTKLKAEGSELSHNLGQLKMQSADGKFYLHQHNKRKTYIWSKGLLTFCISFLPTLA